MVGKQMADEYSPDFGGGMEPSMSSLDLQPPPGWLKGKSNCGITPDGRVQKPSVFCWAWLILLVIGFGVTAISQVMVGVTPCAHDPVAKWRYILSALVSLAIGLLNIYIFYYHCANCNGWTGFWLTFLITIVFGFVTPFIAPFCLEPDVHKPVHKPF
jgi:hypothetical protein